jgi:glycosyltransferase involved in cell wall biosynthesis
MFMGRTVVNAFIVMPAFNEGDGIHGFLSCLKKHVQTLSSETFTNFHWTLLVVNDGSKDNTEECLKRSARELSDGGVTVSYVSLLRNFGHQPALLAGLRTAAVRGADFVITLDADGEHPIGLIREIVEHWQGGAQIVHTSRLPDERLSAFKRRTSSLYYSLLRKFGHLDIGNGMADYKLWDGSLLRQVKSYLNTCGSTRAFASWLVPQAPVVFYRQEFVDGRVSRFTFMKMLSLAINGLVRYSDFPIRLAFYVGLCALAFGSCLFTFAVLAHFLGKTIPGWTSIMAMVVFFGGVQCFLLGIYGEYFLRNLFRTTLPTFVVKRPNTVAVEESPRTAPDHSRSERSDTSTKNTECRP